MRPTMYFPKDVPWYRIVFCLDFFEDRGQRFVRKEMPLVSIRTEEDAREKFKEFKVRNPSGFEGHAYSSYPVLEKVVVLETWGQ